jgi:putative inorganic carbon (HCO3(-)) transporter
VRFNTTDIAAGCRAKFFREQLGYWSFWSACAAAATILVSISVSQILLALSLGILLGSREKLRFPRIWLLLAVFISGTLLSLILSPSPAHGLPQIKKLFVFSMLPVAFSTIRDLRAVRSLFLVWAAIGALTACFGLVRFSFLLHKLQVENRPAYEYYMINRFTGFMSHPMTFGGQTMIVLLLLLAFLFFGPRLNKLPFWIGATAAVLLAGALLINGTRTVWLGAAVAGIWLLWRWRRWLAGAGPIVVLMFMWLVPGPVHDRFLSIFRPRKDVDSNEFRLICFRTGARMIQAHPWFGIGLDETKHHFLDYLPPDTRRPLPPGFYQHLHNVYLQYAAERGIPTMLVMLMILGLILYDFGAALRRLPSGRSDANFLLHGGIATVIGIMVSGVFEVNLGDSEVLTVFLVVVAGGYVAVPRSHTVTLRENACLESA